MRTGDGSGSPLNGQWPTLGDNATTNGRTLSPSCGRPSNRTSLRQPTAVALAGITGIESPFWTNAERRFRRRAARLRLVP
jgi:hypothetical protein